MQWTFENYRLDTDNAILWRDDEQVDLRPKTFDVLQYLVEHAGDLVRKETLLESVWENTYVVEGVLTTSMSELRKVFGDTAKNQRFIATVYRRGYRFVASVNEQNPDGESALAGSGLTSPDTDSPRDVSQFPRLRTMVGREQECDDLIERLAHNPDCRLLSLIGPGGIGKTHLAVMIVRLMAEREHHPFSDGFCFIQLQAQDEPEEFCSDINEALGLQSDGELSPQQHLQNYLGNKQMLLLIDNFEYHLDFKEVLTELIKNAPGIKLLVTSRESLNIPDAWFHPVNGLKSNDSADDEAVRVFAFLARRNQPAFDVDEKLPQVLRICQMVEGMPLALELAASWLKMLSMDEVVSEITEGLDFLQDQFGGENERQGSVRAVFNESWERLTETERILLKQVSMFRNGADRAAIKSVIGAGLPILARLVNKALLYTTPQMRYRMHELIRQFAEEELARDEAFQIESRDKHAIYYLQFIAERLEPMRSAEQGVTCKQIQADFDNIRSAWRWALSRRQYDWILPSIRAISFFCDLRGYFQDGLSMFNAAIAKVEADDPPQRQQLMGQLQMRAGLMNFRLSRYEPAMTLFKAVLENKAVEYEQTFVLRFLGDYHFSHSGYVTAEEARDYLVECVDRSERFNNLHIKTECLCQLTVLYTNLMIDIEKSQQCALEAVQLARQIGRSDLLANALDVHAWTLNHRGDYAEAEAQWREVHDIATQAGNRRNKALAVNWLGWSAWSLGGERHDEAVELFNDALRRYQDLGDRANVSMTCADLSTVLMEQGRLDEARELCQRGLELALDTGREDHHVYNLYTLGAIECEAGNLRQAKQYLAKARVLAWEQEEQTNKPVVVYYIVRLMYAEFTKDAEAAGEEVLSTIVTVLLFLKHYPPTWQAFKDRAGRLLEQIESRHGSQLLDRLKSLPEEKIRESALQLVPQLLSGKQGD